MNTLANSPGWMVKSPKKLIQSLEPPCSVPMKMGRMSNTMPAMPNVYL